LSATSTGSPEQLQFLTELLERGLLVASGTDGLFGRGALFEDIRLAFNRVVSRAAAPESAEALHFPPLVPRRQIERTGYLGSFPHLAGTVFAFSGTESQALEQQARAARHEDWSEFQAMTDLMLAPAACYPVYPAVAARGPLPADGVLIDVGSGYVFRHEPSPDPTRLQSFHLRELVRIGDPAAVRAWRDAWRDRGVELLRSLGLEPSPTTANDPFFGRAGRMLAESQREHALKFELHVPMVGPEPLAVASFNYHQDHFGSAFDLRLADGGVAHSACLGFGEERVVLALLRTHGFDVALWPAPVRRVLWPVS